MSKDKQSEPTEWWQLGIAGPNRLRKKLLDQEARDQRDYGREEKVRTGKEKQWSWF